MWGTMERKITEYIIILSMYFCIYILFCSNNTNELGFNLIQVCYFLIICILQLFLSLGEKKNNYLCILEIFICILGVYRQKHFLIFLLPILIYYALYTYINKYIIIIIEIITLILICKEITFDLFLCLILTSMLFMEISNSINNVELIKKQHRHSRNKNYNLMQKLFYLDKYIRQSEIVASLKERNYIAQKMHDSLGHRITASVMQLEVTKEMMDKDNDTSKRCLDNAMNNLKEGMDEIRLCLRNIKPEGESISIQDIKELLNKFQYETSIKTSLIIKGTLAKVTTNQLQAIIQNITESLTNVCKYSNATTVSVSLATYNKVLTVQIKDNGVGSTKIIKGLGLKGMEERTSKINGRINFSGEEGFTINMIIMLEE